MPNQNRSRMADKKYYVKLSKKRQEQSKILFDTLPSTSYRLSPEMVLSAKSGFASLARGGMGVIVRCCQKFNRCE